VADPTLTLDVADLIGKGLVSVFGAAVLWIWRRIEADLKSLGVKIDRLSEEKHGESMARALLEQRLARTESDVSRLQRQADKLADAARSRTGEYQAADSSPDAGRR